MTEHYELDDIFLVPQPPKQDTALATMRSEFNNCFPIQWSPASRVRNKKGYAGGEERLNPLETYKMEETR